MMGNNTIPIPVNKSMFIPAFLPAVVPTYEGIGNEAGLAMDARNIVEITARSAAGIAEGEGAVCRRHGAMLCWLSNCPHNAGLLRENGRSLMKSGACLPRGRGDIGRGTDAARLACTSVPVGAARHRCTQEYVA